MFNYYNKQTMYASANELKLTTLVTETDKATFRLGEQAKTPVRKQNKVNIIVVQKIIGMNQLRSKGRFDQKVQNIIKIKMSLIRTCETSWFDGPAQKKDVAQSHLKYIE